MGSLLSKLGMWVLVILTVEQIVLFYTGMCEILLAEAFPFERVGTAPKTI